ncbi:Oidioi.mRNA.OKI2018_I69.PAR.g10555.t1.cds [Oikopleura dioica]|uniref:Oidioi.mRNA.OKI2018_I69.PAR.g10555.t1.cds n=1 Tax=Oikopleura dioica TaxID=34765 RepID=A0ABN7RR69_OIKDI|nr:Oidioi.mRNA.OKI2018_I69.PAR.g10555.t1.cds [Oikopleura dioica]
MGSEKEMKEKDELLEAGGSATKGTAGFALSVFNLMNAILGSGILGLPYAMAQMGILSFFIICGTVAGLAYYAILLMLDLCKQTGAKAYESLGQKSFGNLGRYLVAACIICQNMGAMSSYLFIIKAEVPSVLKTMLCNPADELCNSYMNPAWWANGTLILTLVTLFVILPLSSLRNIGFLGYTSGFSISCMVFFTLVIIVKYFLHTEPCPLFDDAVASGVMLYSNYTADDANIDSLKDNYLEPANASTLLKTGVYIPGTEETAGHIAAECTHSAHLPEQYCNMQPQECSTNLVYFTDTSVYSMPTMTFSFVCHTAILPIYAELKSQSAGQMKKVAATSLASCFSLYFLASLFGYSTFYNYVQSELLMTYNHTDPSNVLTLIVRACVIIGVILTLPIVHFPARRAVIFLARPKKDAVTDFSWAWHIAVMLLLIGTCFTLVVLVPDIRDIFGLVGATSSSMLVFILPSLFYVKLAEGTYKDNKRKLSAMVFLVFGICFSILTLSIIIYKKFQ